MPNCSLCGEPMPAGEEMFLYHGSSGPCPKLPLERVHEAVGDNLVPQGPTFHWRNGWMFARGEANDVHVWNIERGIDLIIPATEWASISQALRSRPMETITLTRALVESVKLQSHYANLLNQYDGGRRLQFATCWEWIERINQRTFIS